MARRRKSHEEPENLERWLVSYADFITLLFAFFVVMYAISSVNEGKYRVLSETLNSVFMATPTADEPIQVGERLRDVVSEPDAPLAPRPHSGDGESDVPSVAAGELVGASSVRDGSGGEGDGGDLQHDRAATRITDEILISMQEYIDNELVKVNQVGDRIEIEMKEQMLFPSGRARLTRNALAPLRALSRTLKRIPSHLQIEGHTDNVPIATSTFPSNWELSAARAASVVHFLARQGVEPYRMAAVGLGEHRPIAENDDAKGRAANRRVTVVVLTGQREAAADTEDEVPWAEGPAAGSG
jgi:chemotaxis protein MotB